MADSSPFINKKVEEAMSFINTKARLTQTYSGIDIKCVMYLPLMTRGSVENTDKPKIKIFADLQTLSISSTRSITPVRVLGKSSALTYTRGARTFAGTMVFASINRDAFADVYDVGLLESYINASSTMISDQLPPFSIILTASNELGGIATHAIHGVTLVNYGTTYSIDNLYTETTYSYVATDVSPMVQQGGLTRIEAPNSSAMKNATDRLEEILTTQYSREDTLFNNYVNKKLQNKDRIL